MRNASLVRVCSHGQSKNVTKETSTVLPPAQDSFFLQHLDCARKLERRRREDVVEARKVALEAWQPRVLRAVLSCL